RPPRRSRWASAVTCCARQPRFGTSASSIACRTSRSRSTCRCAPTGPRPLGASTGRACASSSLSPGSLPARSSPSTPATPSSAAASPHDASPGSQIVPLRTHHPSSRRWPLLISARASGSRRSAPTAATLHFVTARSVDVAYTTFEDGPLAEDRAGPELRQRLAVDLYPEHAVQQQVDLVTRIALLAARLARADRLDRRLGVAAHHHARQLALERGLDRRDQHLGVFFPPRRVLAERVPVPLLEVGEAGLLGELAGGVVDPVAREGARAGQLEARRTVYAQRQHQGRAARRALELHEGWMADAPVRGDRRAAARGLHEADRRGA